MSKYNQTRLAEELDTHVVFLNAVICGRKTCGREAAIRFSKKTGIPIEVWIAGTTNQKRKAVQDFIDSKNKRRAA